MAKRISLVELTTKVNEGWKKKALAEYYELPVMQMTKVLQMAGLQIRKFHEPKFELVNDLNEVNEINDESVSNIQVGNVIEERPQEENNTTTTEQAATW